MSSVLSMSGLPISITSLYLFAFVHLTVSSRCPVGVVLSLKQGLAPWAVHFVEIKQTATELHVCRYRCTGKYGDVIDRATSSLLLYTACCLQGRVLIQVS